MKTNLHGKFLGSPRRKWVLFSVILIVSACGSLFYLGTTQFTPPTYPNTTKQEQPINRRYFLPRLSCFGIHVQNITHDFTDDQPSQVINYYNQVGIPIRESYSPGPTILYRDSEIWISNFYYNHGHFISVMEIENEFETSIFSQTDFYLLLFSSGPYSTDCRH